MAKSDFSFATLFKLFSIFAWLLLQTKFGSCCPIPGNVAKAFLFTSPVSVSSAQPIQGDTHTVINLSSCSRTNAYFHFKNHIWVLGTQSRVISSWLQTYLSRIISTSSIYCTCCRKTAHYVLGTYMFLVYNLVFPVLSSVLMIFWKWSSAISYRSARITFPKFL